MEALVLLLAGLSASLFLVNSGLPASAWARTHDPRFLLILVANLLLALLSVLWIVTAVSAAAIPVTPPSSTESSLLFAVAVLLTASGVLPHRG